MNKVRFRSGDNKEKVFAGEVRKRVDDYFKNNKISMKGDYRMYLKSIVMLGIYLIPFILILTVSIPPLLALGLAIIIGIGAAGIECLSCMMEHMVLIQLRQV